MLAFRLSYAARLRADQRKNHEEKFLADKNKRKKQHINFELKLAFWKQRAKARADKEAQSLWQAMLQLVNVIDRAAQRHGLPPPAARTEAQLDGESA